jgi:hypothetical protein
LPDPVLFYIGPTEFEASGETWVTYQFEVVNWESYPEDMFGPYPGLPPVGSNPTASRTLVDFHDASNAARIARLASINTRGELQSIGFVRRKSDPPPDLIYIIMTDRLCAGTYTSGSTYVGPTPTATDTPTQTPSPTPLDLGGGVCSPAWEFNRAGDVEGWTANGDLSTPMVSGGSLSTTSMGADPQLLSPSGLDINAEHQNVVEIRMKASAGNQAELFFKTSDDTAFSSAKRLVFAIPNNTSLVTYRLDMRKVSGWEGSIDRLRLDPSDASGARIDLDYVRVCLPTSVKAPSWEFNTTSNSEGWSGNAQITGPSVTGGSMSGTTTGVDARFTSPRQLGIDAVSQNVIEVGLRVSGGASFQIYFQKQTDTSFRGSRGKSVLIKDAGNFVRYRVDMSTVPSWTGTIKRLRLDPTNLSGATVDVDYVRVCMPSYEVKPVWEFSTLGDSEGWTGAGDIGTLKAAGGKLHTRSTGPDPRLMSPTTSVDPRASRFFIAALDAEAGSFLDVFFELSGGGFNASQRKNRALLGDGGRKLYAVDLGDVSKFESGDVSALRFDPVDAGGAGIRIDSMGMLEQQLAVGESFEFNRPGEGEGWSAKRDLSAPIVADGVMSISSTGTVPVLLSPTNMTVNADNERRIILRTNVGAGTRMNLFYKRSTDTTFDATRKKTLLIPHNGSFVTYNVDMSGDDNWYGLVDRLRLDPTNVSGAAIAFDYLRTYGAVQTGVPEWRWSEDGNPEGWSAVGDLSTPVVEDSLLKTTTTGSAPKLWSPGSLTINADTQNWVIIRMKATAGTFGTLYYRPPGGAFSSTMKKRIYLKNNTDFATYQLDMSGDPNWTGAMNKLRLDPTNASGATVEIDYVLLQ